MKVMCKTGQGGCLSVTTTTTTVVTSYDTYYEYVVETGCGDLVEENIGYKGAANLNLN